MLETGLAVVVACLPTFWSLLSKLCTEGRIGSNLMLLSFQSSPIQSFSGSPRARKSADNHSSSSDTSLETQIQGIIPTLEACYLKDLEGQHGLHYPNDRTWTDRHTVNNPEDPVFEPQSHITQEIPPV